MPSDLAVAETTRLSQHHFFISLFLWGVSHQPPGCWQLRVTSKKFSTQIKNRRRQKMFEKKVCSKLCRPLSFSRRHLFRTFEQIWAFRCFYLIGAKWTAAVIVPPKHWFRNIIFFGFRCFRETGTGKVDSLPNMSIKKFCLIRSRCPRNEPEGGLLLFALQSTMIAAKVSRALKMSQKSVMTTGSQTMKVIQVKKFNCSAVVGKTAISAPLLMDEE